MTPVSLRTNKTGPTEDTSSGPHHVWPTASPFPSSPTKHPHVPGPTSSRVRAHARSKEGGLTWRGNVQHWFCLEVGSGTGVPRRPTSRLLVLIGIASLLVPFGLSSNIYNDSAYPPRAMGRIVGELDCQALCYPDSHSSESLGPQCRNMGELLWRSQNRDPDILCCKTLGGRVQHRPLGGPGGGGGGRIQELSSGLLAPIFRYP